MKIRGDLQNKCRKRHKQSKPMAELVNPLPQEAVIAVTTKRFLPFTGPEASHRPEPAVLNFRGEISRGYVLNFQRVSMFLKPM